MFVFFVSSALYFCQAFITKLPMFRNNTRAINKSNFDRTLQSKCISNVISECKVVRSAALLLIYPQKVDLCMDKQIY